MKNKLFSAALLSIFAVTSCNKDNVDVNLNDVTKCSLTILIQDADYNPIAGAKVTLTTGAAATSDNEGKVNFGGMEKGEGYYTVEASGFVGQRYHFYANGGSSYEERTLSKSLTVSSSYKEGETTITRKVLYTSKTQYEAQYEGTTESDFSAFAAPQIYVNLGEYYVPRRVYAKISSDGSYSFEGLPADDNFTIQVPSTEYGGSTYVKYQYDNYRFSTPEVGAKQTSSTTLPEIKYYKE